MDKIIGSDIENLTYQISDAPGPDFLTTSGIQKGLLLNLGGQILCQEGLGFGVPIVREPTNTYFSKKSKINFSSEREIAKTYFFDCVSRIKISTPFVTQTAFFTRIFEKMVSFYMKKESLQPILLKALQIATKIFQGKCIFVDIDEIGDATVHYHVQGNSIAIEAAFHTSLSDPVFTMANEQGADFFDWGSVDGKLIDSKEIKGWMRVSEATYISTEKKISFTLEGVKDKTIFLGRERTEFLRWAGINLEGRNPSFEYVVKMEEDI
jgi:hypothetical protein